MENLGLPAARLGLWHGELTRSRLAAASFENISFLRSIGLLLDLLDLPEELDTLDEGPSSEKRGPAPVVGERVENRPPAQHR